MTYFRFSSTLCGCWKMDTSGAAPHTPYLRNDPATFEPNPLSDPYPRHQSSIRHSQPVFYSSHTIYVPPQQPPTPQSHKVWILDCKLCGTFLTNRGMKAVLLLRPNVPLYSTDALPANCSAFSSVSDAPMPPPSNITESVRTCECLTQTLCCHGCGNTVGYMIVIPCQRCTSSMSASNRSTNGHRFVFHSFEVAASERHYVNGEPGVIPYHPPPPPLCPAVRMTPSSTHPSPISINGPPIRLPHAGEYHPGQTRQYSEISASPTVDVDSDEWDIRVSPPPAFSFGPARPPAPARTPPPAPQIQQSGPPPRPPSPVMKLKAGDMLYWHHLSRHGEIPGVQEDPRARGKGSRQRLSQGFILKDDGSDNDMSLNVTGMTVVCGR